MSHRVAREARAGTPGDDREKAGALEAFFAKSSPSLVPDPATCGGGPMTAYGATGSDAASDGLRPIPHSPVPANPHEVPLRNRDGSGFFIAPHRVLAEDAVRYVAEPFAVVVAETLADAMDAAERVNVELNVRIHSPPAESPCLAWAGPLQLET